jgi:transketolase
MVVAERKPTRMAFVDIGDTYATSGKPEELLRQYGLTPEAISDAAHRILKD